MNYTKSTALAFDIACFLQEGYTEVEARQVLLLNDMMHRQAKRKCAAEGHRIVDSSYGGPESGCVDLCCTRCGYRYHVTLY